MSASAVNRLIGQIGRSVAAERFERLPDGELLRLVNSGDAVALEATVRRRDTRPDRGALPRFCCGATYLFAAASANGAESQ